MIDGFQMLERTIREKINSELDRTGIQFRLFSRAKDLQSLESKIESKGKYEVDGDKVQDIIGIRIVTYFKDDISLTDSIIKSLFEIDSTSIDEHDPKVFAPKRHNIVCKLEGELCKTFNEVIESSTRHSLKLVDSTFEVQLRTILSEGWHEIDHGLRYKCKEDWDGYPENERLLNGIYATLETSDQALKNLFDQLSYNQYKEKNWEGMLRNKFRLKFRNDKPLSQPLKKILNENNDFSKKLFRADRNSILKKIIVKKIALPITFDNILFIANHYILKFDSIVDIQPEIVSLALKDNV